MSVHSTLNHSNLRRALLVGAAVSALSSVADYAQAQDQGGATMETVVVTGSKIARKDADSVGPLTTLTAEDIQNTGSLSIGEILQKLPGAGVSYNSNGTQGTSFGASSINLRYLANSDGDADRTLVLVDGHRWVDALGIRGIRDFVDLNTIPIGMVGSMEVLQDGASAIYGADAIAGVVNIHTVQKLDGISLNAKIGTSSRGDGEEYSGFVNWGVSLPHGSIFLSASYVNTQPVLAQGRALTRLSLTAGLANLSAPPTSPSGLYVLPGFSTSAAPWTQNAGVTVATGPSSYHTAALPGDYWNANSQGLDDISPSQRYGFYGRVTNELTNDITFTFDALYNRRMSELLYGPRNLSIGGTGGTNKGFSIDAHQAYNPFGVAFTASQAWSIQIITNQVGNLDNIEDDSNYRFSGGLQGSVGVLDRQFAWNLFGSFSENDMKFTASGLANLENLQLALGNPATCAATAGCVPVNIFGQMTPAMADYIRYTGHETNSTQLFDLSADATGNIFQLPAGPLGMAVGLEYRRVVGHDTPDAYINTVSTGSGLLPLPATTQTTSGTTRTPTANGSYNVTEAYIELNIPILADLPLAKSLEADVAERFSDYDSVGSHFSGKVGIGYRPFEDLLLRGTFSQGFRAPSLIELYTGRRDMNLPGNNTDPCNGGAAAHPTLPGCAGIPSTYNQLSYGGLLPETVSGNPNLKPETAETFSYGLSLTPEALKGFSFTADWYQVTLYNAISLPSTTTALMLCATQAGAYCNVVQRDPTTGQVLHFLSAYENLNKIRTAGLDTTVRYSFDTDVGNWDAVVSSTYLDRFTTEAPNPVVGGAAIITNAAGTSTGGTTPATARATYPRWKGQASLRWSNDVFGLMWRGRFIGQTVDGAAPALPVTPVKNGFVNSVTYHDLQADYTFKEHSARVTFGINNVFDQMPPASYSNAPINFDMYTYDIMGRYFYLKLSKDF